MRQTYAKEYTRAHEIDMLVRDVKSKQRRLETKRIAHSCKDGCTGCAPCRKGYYEADCETRWNDIPGANRERWKAWAELDRELQELERIMQRFSRNYNVRAIVDTIWDAIDILKAVIGKKPEDIAHAAGSAYKLVQRVFNYNKVFSDEAQREIAPKLIDIEKFQRRATEMDGDFWKLIRAYEVHKCPRSLPSTHFNRP